MWHSHKEKQGAINPRCMATATWNCIPSSDAVGFSGDRASNSLRVFGHLCLCIMRKRMGTDSGSVLSHHLPLKDLAPHPWSFLAWKPVRVPGQSFRVQALAPVPHVRAGGRSLGACPQHCVFGCSPALPTEQVKHPLPRSRPIGWLVQLFPAFVNPMTLPLSSPSATSFVWSMYATSISPCLQKGEGSAYAATTQLHSFGSPLRPTWQRWDVALPRAALCSRRGSAQLFGMAFK